MGHGSGSQFYPVDDVQKNSSRLCVLLMGCSSARLQSLGDFEVFGMPFAYLTCGAYVFSYLVFLFNYRCFFFKCNNSWMFMGCNRS
jgi:hypothetical protein